MKRLIGYLLGTLLVVAVVCAPALAWNIDTGSDSSEDTTITQYDVDYTLAKNGELTATETLTVDFPTYGKHGIFRFWDRADNASGGRGEPKDITVTRDGSEEPFTIEHQEHDRFTVAKIGSASSTLDPGEHVYVLRYTVPNAINKAPSGSGSEFFWDVIPGGWLQPITTASITVHLPVAAGDKVECAQGDGGVGTCDAAGAGTKTLTVQASDLAPNTPVTVRTHLDLATPAIEGKLPWAARWDRVFGTRIPLLVLVILAGIAAAVVGGVLGKRSREKEPGFPLMYAPPDGIGPGQATYILRETTTKETYVANLMYAAEKGAIKLDQQGDAWTITDLNDPSKQTNLWGGLDPVTVGMAHILSGPGTSFTATKSSVEAGKRLRDEIAKYDSSVETWAKTSGNMIASGLGGFGGILIVGSLVALVANTIWNPFNMTLLGLVPGLFAVFGGSLMATGAGTMRTRQGRDLWSRIGGFERILKTPSSKDRFDFSGRQELYTAYIPWAVAFGCAEEWAAKYKTEMGQEPPSPSYFGAYAGASAASHVSSMVDSFSSTVDGAISSYNATQSSSSSGGGGGFSGGGGGGGGGGGSW